MRTRAARVAAAGGLVAVLVAATACTFNPESSTSGAAAKPGGTLRIVATSDIDHIDPTTAGTINSNNVQHAISRTLIGYQSSMDEGTRVQTRGDLATEVPVPTDNGLTYTYAIRQGANFDAPGGPRQITSADFARGMALMCNPVQASPRLGYVEDLIVGMRAFCDGFSKSPANAASMKSYLDAHHISGIDTSDPKTVVVHLLKPAGDFNYMLSLPSTAPQPIEALSYMPDSPDYRKKFVSSGPYTVGEYTPNVSLTLVRNKAWSAASDQLKKGYVDQIKFTFGVTPQAALQQLQSGDADLSYDIVIPTASLQQLSAAKDSKLVSFDAGLTEFVWMNTKSNNNNGALRNLKVRQALEYAMDKAAIVQSLGGTQAAAVQNGILGPGVNGFHAFNPYPSQNTAGDPAKAKQLLAEAGYPDGLTLKMPYMTSAPEPARAQTIQASLAKAGFKITLVPVSAADYYAKFMTNRTTTSAGAWDIAPASWQPDWVGGAARSVFQAQFTFHGTPQTYNYGDFNDDKAVALADQALATPDQTKSAKLWQQVDEQVMSDAIVIPTDAIHYLLYHSAAVQNFLLYPLGSQADWTNVWLSK
ncbi:MAG TPA: ABC transporter substrate-binding protein [Kribbella sp.]